MMETTCNSPAPTNRAAANNPHKLWVACLEGIQTWSLFLRANNPDQIRVVLEETRKQDPWICLRELWLLCWLSDIRKEERRSLSNRAAARSSADGSESPSPGILAEAEALRQTETLPAPPENEHKDAKLVTFNPAARAFPDPKTLELWVRTAKNGSYPGLCAAPTLPIAAVEVTQNLPDRAWNHRVHQTLYSQDFPKCVKSIIFYDAKHVYMESVQSWFE